MVILFTMKSYHLKSRIMLVVSIRNINILWNYIECVCSIIRWNIESPEHIHISVCVCVYIRRERKSEPNRAFMKTVLFFYALRKK